MTDTTAIRCSAQSLQAAEQLFGTAANNEVWFLLEYTSAWGAKVLPESDLSAPVKDRLNGYLKSVPKSNLLFIKQPKRTADTLTLYVALATETQPRLYRFGLNSYDDLLTLDLAGVVARDVAYESQLVDEPLFLVCTNAKRDLCCGKYGPAIYKAIEKYTDHVWQCSHIGGHRFAPTMLVFPLGLCYGRIHESEIDELVDYTQAGKVYLERLRGRVCYPEAVQAADYYLRQQQDELALNAYHLQSFSGNNEEGWQVKFTSSAGDRDINLQRVPADVSIQNSCGADEWKPVFNYVMV